MTQQFGKKPTKPAFEPMRTGELDEVTYFERRWSIEVMPRGLKQTCGFGRAQANIGRVGRNHIGLSMLALIRKHRTRRLDYKTPYQHKTGKLLNLLFNLLYL